jgi:hypothetical protein
MLTFAAHNFKFFTECGLLAIQSILELFFLCFFQKHVVFADTNFCDFFLYSQLKYTRVYIPLYWVRVLNFVRIESDSAKSEAQRCDFERCGKHTQWLNSWCGSAHAAHLCETSRANQIVVQPKDRVYTPPLAHCQAAGDGAAARCREHSERAPNHVGIAKRRSLCHPRGLNFAFDTYS